MPKTKTADREIDEAQAYISQAELAAVVELQHIMSVLCLNLRRRLGLGAQVEPGKWRIEAEPADDQFLEQFNELQAERLRSIIDAGDGVISRNLGFGAITASLARFDAGFRLLSRGKRLTFCCGQISAVYGRSGKRSGPVLISEAATGNQPARGGAGFYVQRWTYPATEFRQTPLWIVIPGGW